MSYQESHLIGDILDEEAPGHARGIVAPTPTAVPVKPIKPLRSFLDKTIQGEFRSSSAPPVLPMLHHEHPQSPEVVAPDDPRLDPQYAAYYYAQRTLNPRLPPPVQVFPNPQQIYAYMQQQAQVQSVQAQLVNQDSAEQGAVPVQPVPSQESSASVDSANEPHPSWPLEDKPRSVVDKIQQDFPRTPSPALQAIGPPPITSAPQTAAQPSTTTTTQTTKAQSKITAPRPQHAAASTQALYDSAQAQMQKLSLQQQQQQHDPSLLQDPRQFADAFGGYLPYAAVYSAMYPPQYAAQIQMQQRLAQQQFMYQGAPPQMPMEDFVGQPGWDMQGQQKMMQHGMRQGDSRHGRQQRGPSQRSQQSSPNVVAGDVRVRPGHGVSADSSHGGEGTRSTLLEEFRSNKTKEFELRDIAGYVVEFSTDQHGSRFIQQKLEVAGDEDKQMVFDEILPKALTLMTDVFGNYVIQKFFEHGSREQKRRLAQELVGNVLPLTLQMYGCRVIQKALEVVERDQQATICKELHNQVLVCVKDQNGNHVIQKCIEKVAPDLIQFIVDAFRGQVFALATHAYGCRVIQRILEHCSLEQTMPVLQELLHHIHDLVQDQYGNYVIQHVLTRGKLEHRALIMQELSGHIVRYSQHKFASNVIEKCMQHATQPQRDTMIEEILHTNTGSSSPLEIMMKDQYANYVVQRMMEVCNDQHRAKILQFVSANVAMLKRFTFAKHILARIEKTHGKLG